MKNFVTNNPKHGEVQESTEVVVSTSTMPPEDMLEAYVFTWFIWTTHLSGMTTWTARFLNKHLDISYEEFYTKLKEFLTADAWFSDQTKLVTKIYKDFLTTGEFEYSDADAYMLYALKERSKEASY